MFVCVSPSVFWRQNVSFESFTFTRMSGRVSGAAARLEQQDIKFDTAVFERKIYGLESRFWRQTRVYGHEMFDRPLAGASELRFKLI